MKTRAKVIPLARRPGPEDALIEVDGVRKVFPVGASFLTVLDEVRFQVSRGELVCIIGRSGCGKSTLLKILAGFLAPSAGKVLLNGETVARPGPDRCMVFQEDALFPWLTVRENVAFGLRGKGLSTTEVREQVDKFLALVGLREFHNYLPRHISGGMKQRVALARVLILEPQVLLMDEPFAALDAQTREEMQDLLLTLWRQLSHTIIFVTHDITEAVALADRVLVMSTAPGRIQQQLRVELARPRRRDREDFMDLAGKLSAALR
ncbi:ABC transporter ATP-binding protein [Desulfoferrobacter suflitae]|uniref:ABC transporter ATP-binding protein n=1 Tax=Desulfoferrobacter suflitae TaxID=2865782 RepID=UPI0021649E84|nr:ABC transporter ATP-binding protein [Desulfoferrobacter suflitae]MCK8601849.1 ABC transporter ATP-binding protein [Desulfoferrobacter suflitae]